MECKDCRYYNEDDDNCGAFTCNGLECPKLPCETGEDVRKDDTMKLFEFVVEPTNDSYIISANNLILTDEDLDDITYDDVEIIKNGKRQSRDTVFGITFAGHKYNADDVLLQVIEGYMNDDTAYEFTYVCDTIKDFKEATMPSSYLTNTDDIERPVSKTYFQCYPYVRRFEADYIAKDISVYSYEDLVKVLDTSTGMSITDMETFCTECIIDSIKKNSPIFFANEDNLETFKRDYAEYL